MPLSHFLFANKTYPLYCVWTSATVEASWLVLVALCGTEVAYRGCSGLNCTGRTLETVQACSECFTQVT